MDLKRLQSGPAAQVSLDWGSMALKRLIDVVCAALGLLFLWPLFVLIAVAIKRSSPGPVFYRGRRTGRGGKEFLILKFRTMYETPESYAGPKVTAANDPRITPIGEWLRKTKLNELPQLWNVLKGEMSLVGPRPEDPDIAASWPPEAREVILAVRPGITSPASVHYYNEETLLSCDNLLDAYLNQVGPEKLRLDQLYVRNRSLWLDLDALLWTFLLVLPKIRKFGPPEELLFVGPITRLMRRFINWFVIDWAVTFTAMAVVALVWRMTEPLNVGLLRAVAVALGFSLIFSITGSLTGLNKISWTRAALYDGYRLFPVWLISTTISFLINSIGGFFPPALVLLGSFLAGGGFVITRYRTRLGRWLLSYISSSRAARAARRNVLILGTGPSAQHAAWMFSHPAAASRYRVAGFVDDDLFVQGLHFFGAHVIGRTQDLDHLIQKYNIDLVLMPAGQAGEKVCRAAVEAHRAGRVQLMVIPDYFSALDCLCQSPRAIPVTADTGGQEPASLCLHCLLYGQPPVQPGINESARKE